MTGQHQIVKPDRRLSSAGGEWGGVGAATSSRFAFGGFSLFFLIRRRAMKHHGAGGLFVHGQAENLGPRIMAGHVEIVLAFDDFVEVELRGQDALFVVTRPGEEL